MKDFLLIGNLNAVTYKEFFPLLKEGTARPGYTFGKKMEFILSDAYDTWLYIDGDGHKIAALGNAAWFTTLPVNKTKTLTLTKTYDPDKYPKYDNYDAINVDRTRDIPYDYDGVMGVPITFLEYNYDGFEIIGLAADKRYDIPEFIKADPIYLNDHNKNWRGVVLNGKAPYARLIIKKKTN